ncbi:hypothetical protein T310_7325, partial [Rasamsonia emersonii CBS 393.64]
MPSFFAPGLHGLPPTPPHLHGSSRMEHDQPYYLTGQSAFPPRYSQTGCEFIEQYSQATCFVKPAPVNMHAQHMPQMRNGRDLPTQQPLAQSQLSVSQAMFGPMTSAPVLPPIRSNVQLPPMDSAIPPQYRRQDMVVQPEQQPPKEEKATGGVAAYLDYEMDQMSDFVAEMAQGMYALYITKINLADIDFARSVYPGTPVPPQFRKYVHQILSSTRLPSSTILLGLFYLATRMRMLSAAGVYLTGSGQVYRMLTTALLLGSKFLDDNTFQNRSWAEVSNIPVAELNSMELDWLFAFEWKIHERIHNPQDGFAVWLSHWENYRAKMAGRGNEARQKLAPLDTNIARQHAVPKPLLSPRGSYPAAVSAECLVRERMAESRRVRVFSPIGTPQWSQHARLLQRRTLGVRESPAALHSCMDATSAAVHAAAAATVATAVLPADAVLLAALYPERVDG